MKLVKILYKACVGFSELKISLLLNEDECIKECKRVYPTLKIFINNLKDKIDEIGNLIEKYSNDEKIAYEEKVNEKYIENITKKYFSRRKGVIKMKLEARNLLEEKLFELKQIMFDMFTNEYNSKFCKRDYATLNDTIEQYKNVIDDIDSIIEKYC